MVGTAVMSGTPAHSPESDADPGDELVDVVDDDDRVVATVTRREMRARRLRHRVVFIIVTSTTGELLVHRRSEDKDLWPGRWDIGVGGVVGAGESYEAAGQRELAEEVGVLDAAPAFVADGRYADPDVDLIARAFRVVHDGPFRFADGEVVEARWVDAAGLVALIAAEPFVPDSLTLLPMEVLFPFSTPGDPQGR
jgi:isopentenyldiphosphate isomerase